MVIGASRADCNEGESWRKTWLVLLESVCQALSGERRAVNDRPLIISDANLILTRCPDGWQG